MKIRKATVTFICFVTLLPAGCGFVRQAADPGSSGVYQFIMQPPRQQTRLKTEEGAPRYNPPSTAGHPTKKQVIYAGYSKAFMPVKKLIVSGRIEEAAGIYSRENKGVTPTFGAENLKKGMKGPRVAEVQHCLKAKGFDVGSVDGIFGPATKAAVMQFQRDNGLNANGIVDRNTWNDLHRNLPADFVLKKLPADAETCLLRSKELVNLEGGTLAVDSGAFDVAVDRFSAAEDLFARQERGGKIWSWLKKGFIFIGETVSGDEEFQPYTGEGYERVLMLNYKSIAYLLQGDRKAYNVTRRAINWQNIEKKRFESQLKDIKRKLAEKEAREKSKDKDFDVFNIRKMIAKEFAAMDSRAISVPNAYVNPFGFYVAGMVQEFESLNDTSLRDNARISYKKALDLNPASEVLKQAVQELKKVSAPVNKRLVHVVLADGFVPEKKLLILPLPVTIAPIPIKLPLYQPVRSRVHRAAVYDGKGRKLASLSTVADIEAICLRHQKDSEPFRYFRALLAAGRSYLISDFLSQAGAFGSHATKTIVEMATPDMRSWMSLPATIQAARFYIPRNEKKIRITTYDAKGRRLASRTVILDTSGNNFVYVRSLDKLIFAHANKRLWLVSQ